MKFIFVDNFRGFKETLLPLKDVNFFVGENSTGKTSVLALINILDSPDFWISGHFKRDESDLGDFEDIVSLNSEDRAYFNVGMFTISDKESKKQGRSNIYNAYLMKFVEKDGLPKISRYTFVRRRRRIKVTFNGQSIRYNVGDAKPIHGNNIASVKALFKSWIDTAETEEESLDTLEAPEEIGSSLAILNSYLDNMLKGKKPLDEGAIGVSWLRPYYDVHWLAPIRTQPKPLYEKFGVDFSPEGEHTPYVIRKILSNKKSAEKFSRFIKKFGKESALFDSIEIQKFGRVGEAVSRVIPETGPFELDVVLHGTPFKITNVGYGVSQSLPLVVEIFRGDRDASYLIQQPEVHLHPKAQAAFGSLLYRSVVSENKRFLVETHSDFIINSYRLNQRRGRKKPSSQVLFFEQYDKGNRVHPIEIKPNGDMPEKQPEKYRRFFIQEKLRMLGF